jgi:hypothetical protein
MKKIWKSLVNFFESMGRARAAGILVRQGRIQEAKDLYLR